MAAQQASSSSCAPYNSDFSHRRFEASAMSQLFDLSRLTYDEFVSFFFSHDVETEGDWYLDPEYGFSDWFSDEGVTSPAVVVRHMTRLCTEFTETATKFSAG